MTAWWTGLLLGALGAAVADGSRIGAVMLASKRWPWSQAAERLPFAVALTIRITAAATMASIIAGQTIVGWSDQPLVLFGIGLAGPSVVEHGARFMRVALRAIFNEYFRGGGDDDARS